MGNAFATGFTSGMHLALWVSGLMMLAGAPIAFLTIRRTAPHHVAAREVVAQEAGATAARAAIEDTTSEAGTARAIEDASAADAASAPAEVRS